MKVTFLQDYSWYPNGFTKESFETLEQCDLDEKVARRLVKAGIAEWQEEKKEPAKVEKVEEKPAKKEPKKPKTKMKAKNKKVKKETVEEK